MLSLGHGQSNSASNGGDGGRIVGLSSGTDADTNGNDEDFGGEKDLAQLSKMAAKEGDTGELTIEDLEILDLDDDDEDTVIGEDNWLVSPPGECEDLDNFLRPSLDLQQSPAKQSLVTKLDALMRGSNTPVRYQPPMSFGATSNFPSPYRMNNGLSSTPSRQGHFDSRTFTRNRRPQLPEMDRFSPIKASHSVGGVGVGGVGNATFDFGGGGSDDSDVGGGNGPGGLNSTFTLPSPAAAGGGGNLTFDRRTSSSSVHNATFRASSSDRFVPHNATFDVGEDGEDDRVSNASEGSSSAGSAAGKRRLDSVGDVQHVAKMQEESLRQPYNQRRNNTVTLSPSSENSTNSPSQETEGYQQYSSQDSLPDSPYSSQSLDSQPMLASDRLGRSMPNLNKRGLGPGGAANVPPRHVAETRRMSQQQQQQQQQPPYYKQPHHPTAGVAAAAQSSGYGLSRYNHAGSDTRLQQVRRGEEMRQPQPPMVNRQQQRPRQSVGGGGGNQVAEQRRFEGNNAGGPPRYVPPPRYVGPRSTSASAPTFRPAPTSAQSSNPGPPPPQAMAAAPPPSASSSSSSSRIARPPVASSIPRPGSRLPTFQRAVPGMPRQPPGGGGPSSSAAAAASSARGWREDCY